MPNVMSVLRAEIRRLARKESKEAVRDLRRQVTAMRRRMAAAKQQMAELERLAKRSVATVGAAATAAKSDASDAGQQIRFSPRWVRVHRAKLKLSRKSYSKLVGVSPQTILLWETGKTRPRRGVLAAWRELRSKGIRELKAALEGGGGKRAAGKAAKKVGRPAKRRKAAGRRGTKRAARGAGKARAARPARAARGRAARTRVKRSRGARAKKK